MPEIIKAGAGSGTGTGGNSAITTGSQATEYSSTAVAEPEVKFGHPDAIQEEHGRQEESGNEDTGETLQDSADDFGAEDFADIGDGAPDYTQPFPKEFAEALAQNPQLLKQVKRYYFENSRYKQIPGFESPEKAREISDRLESLGGIAGIETETKEAANLWNMLGAGDPGILDTLEKEYGDGLQKLAPHVLDRFQKLDPAGWNHKMAGVFMATVTQSGMVDAINTLADNAEIVKIPEVKRALEKIINAVNAVDSHAKNAPRADLSTEAQKIKTQRQQLAQDRNVLYQQQVSAQIVPLMRKEATTALASILKDRKLSPESRKDLLADLNLEYARLAKNNTEFQQNAKDCLAANETDKFIRLCQSNMRKTMPLAARNIWKKYSGIGGFSQEKEQRRAEGQSRRESGGGSAAGNTIKTAAPKATDVDWARMRAEFGRDGSDEMFMFKRQYYKKGDKSNKYSY